MHHVSTIYFCFLSLPFSLPEPSYRAHPSWQIVLNLFRTYYETIIYQDSKQMKGQLYTGEHLELTPQFSKFSLWMLYKSDSHFVRARTTPCPSTPLCFAVGVAQVHGVGCPRQSWAKEHGCRRALPQASWARLTTVVWQPAPDKEVLIYFGAFYLTTKYLKKKKRAGFQSKVELKLRPLLLKHPNCRLFGDQTWSGEVEGEEEKRTSSMGRSLHAVLFFTESNPGSLLG